MSLSRRTFAMLLVGLYLLAFIPRAYQPISHARHWLKRSNNFREALADRRWGGTHQRRHPGLTTMAAAGVTLEVYDAVSNTVVAELFNWAIPAEAQKPGIQMSVGVFGISAIIAAVIVGSALSLYLLTNNRWLALMAGGLMALEPYVLAQSRVLHVDGLLASFMLLSALLLLVSLHLDDRRYFWLSGVVGGLAVLTKTPALFLVLYTGLALLVYLLLRLRSEWDAHAEGRLRWVLGMTWRHVASRLLLWMALMVVPFVFWPAMWVKPVRVLDEMFGGALQHFFRPHGGSIVLGNQVFFEERASPLYYPVTMAFNLTFLSATLALVGLGHFTLWRRRLRPPMKPLIFWLLVAFIFFFGLQMTIGAKFSSGGRYILPVYPALDIVAAIGAAGLVSLIRTGLDRGKQRLAHALPLVAAIVVVGLQGLIALPYAPYYGAHNNHLLGGNRVANNVLTIIDEAEGIIYVAEYLNSQPDADQMTVAVATGSVMNTFYQYFEGETVRTKHLTTDELTGQVDYYLFDVGSVQRTTEDDPLDEATIAYAFQPPEMRVVFDGIDFLWVVKAEPSAEAGQNVIVHYDGRVFVAVAWIWTVLLLGTLLWALSRQTMSEERTGLGATPLEEDTNATPA